MQQQLRTQHGLGALAGHQQQKQRDTVHVAKTNR